MAFLLTGDLIELRALGEQFGFAGAEVRLLTGDLVGKFTFQGIPPGDYKW